MLLYNQARQTSCRVFWHIRGGKVMSVDGNWEDSEYNGGEVLRLKKAQIP